MIDAAERLIAEKGLGALSLREVATAAGQRNHSAVQYHFGSRARLVEAVFDTRMTPIDARRAEMLVALERSGATDDLRALCDVFVRPLGEAVLLGRPGWYGRFLSEVMRSEPALLRAERPAMASVDRTTNLMISRMGSVPVSLRVERIRMAVRAAISMLADRETELSGTSTPVTTAPAHAPTVYVTHVVDLLHAALSAPPSPALTADLAAADLT
jgi:AcrR family transcriptional regulator